MCKGLSSSQYMIFYCNIMLYNIVIQYCIIYITLHYITLLMISPIEYGMQYHVPLCIVYSLANLKAVSAPLRPCWMRPTDPQPTPACQNRSRNAMRRPLLALATLLFATFEWPFTIPVRERQLNCPSLALLQDATELQRLQDPKVLTGFVPLPCDALWSRHLAALPLFDVSKRISEAQDLQGLATELPLSTELREAAVAHAARLMETFRKALRWTPGALRLRLRCLEHVQCSRLHFDEVPLRLVCAFSGPGTLVLPERKAKRRNLEALYQMPLEEQGAMSSVEWNRHLAHQQDLVQAPSGWAVLLKGSTYSSASPGVLHCSPPAAKRLLLQLDEA